MDTAALLGKYIANDATALPAATVLGMATINGARALGIDENTGSLIRGKSADAICVELAEPGTVPVLDPLSLLVYAAGREHVTDVWVEGEHLVSDRSLTRMNVETIIERSAHWAERITAS